MSKAIECLVARRNSARSNKEAAERRIEELAAEQATERGYIAKAEADIADFEAALIVLGEITGG